MKQKSTSFMIACWMLLGVLYVRLLLPLVSEETNLLGINVEGFARFLCLAVIAIVLFDHLSRFSFVFKYERRLMLFILAFLGLMTVQLLLVGNTAINVQGSIKYLFYFGIIAISIYGAVIYSDKSIDILLNISLLLFMSVLIFYPYLIVESGDDPLSRLMEGDERMHYLLMAANEDAHFMTALMMLVYIKLKKQKLLLAGIGGLFFLALIYNGTRSAFLIAFLLPIIYYVFLKRKFVISTAIITVVVTLSLPYVVPFLETKFEEDMGVLEDPDKVMSGKQVGGSASWRIAYVWYPTINYTLKQSPIIGNGSNGWDIVSLKLLNKKKKVVESPHNFFIWAFVNWGFLGLLLLLIIFFIPISYVCKVYVRDKRSTNEKDKELTVALLCCWIEFFVWSFLANSYNAQGWVIITILIVLSIALKYKDFSRSLIDTYESSNRKYA